jgi:hypothetical protein
MLHYRTNDKIFFNVYLAYNESLMSGRPVEFYCYDDQNDLHDWTQEPQQDFDILMDAHAIALRNRYDKLCLAWSGGSDSHTIYNVFKRNNLHLDEILICYDPTGFEPHMPLSHAEWMQTNHWDPTTRITVAPRFDPDGKRLSVTNEDWIFENRAFLNKFSASVEGDANHRRLQDDYAGTNWAIIQGREKPNVYCEQGLWYTRQSDDVLSPLLGIDHIECFFLDPVLNIKQSHMAKRATKLFQQRNPDSTRQIDQFNTDLEYRIWCKILGRHMELNPGVSYAQKRYNIEFEFMQGEFLYGRHNVNFDRIEGSLKIMLEQKNPVAQNYVKGFYNMQSEQRLYQFLLTRLERSGGMLKKQAIWSKSYCLGA